MVAEFSQSQEKPVLVFLHIPKTGGMTLSSIIIQHYPGDKVFHIRNPKISKAPLYSQHYGSYDDFVNLPAEERASYDCVLGHLRYGLHRMIQRPCRYVALFRDPVERLLSQHGQYNRMVVDGAFKEGEMVDLQGFLKIRKGAMDNVQSQFIVGWDYFDLDDETRRVQALENVRNGLYVTGTMERFDEVLMLLNRRMGWQDLPYQKENVGEHRSKQTDHPPEVLETIRQANWLDTLLLHEAERKLDAGMAEFPDISRRLAGFQAGNWKASLPPSSVPRSTLRALAGRVKRSVLEKFKGGFGRSRDGR